MIAAPRVFVTGSTGFLGRRVLHALDRRGFAVTALDRRGSIRRHRIQANQLEVVEADLLEPSAYGDALRKAAIVVHLAASTGRASAHEHFRVNVRGTEALLEQCERAGTQRILFVSSIAAKFPDKRQYWYAIAKARSEEAVRKSGLRFTILRPTMIFGKGSPVLSALEKLAALPMVPVFGDGRTQVQPIYVEDVVGYILAVLEQDRFHGETLEIGGPATLTIEDLLHEIRAALGHSGDRRSRFLHIPLGLLLPPLQAAESIGLGRLLPFSVGQLSSFRFDGTVETNPLYESRRSTLRGVQDMLALSRVA